MYDNKRDHKIRQTTYPNGTRLVNDLCLHPGFHFLLRTFFHLWSMTIIEKNLVSVDFPVWLEVLVGHDAYILHWVQTANHAARFRFGRESQGTQLWIATHSCILSTYNTDFLIRHCYFGCTHFTFDNLFELAVHVRRGDAEHTSPTVSTRSSNHRCYLGHEAYISHWTQIS